MRKDTSFQDFETCNMAKELETLPRNAWVMRKDRTEVNFKDVTISQPGTLEAQCLVMILMILIHLLCEAK